MKRSYLTELKCERELLYLGILILVLTVIAVIAGLRIQTYPWMRWKTGDRVTFLFGFIMVLIGLFMIMQVDTFNVEIEKTKIVTEGEPVVEKTQEKVSYATVLSISLEYWTDSFAVEKHLEDKKIGGADLYDHKIRNEFGLWMIMIVVFLVLLINSYAMIMKNLFFGLAGKKISKYWQHIHFGVAIASMAGIYFSFKYSLKGYMDQTGALYKKMLENGEVDYGFTYQQQITYDWICFLPIVLVVLSYLILVIKVKKQRY